MKLCKALFGVLLLALPLVAGAQQASFVTMIGTNTSYANGTMTANFLPPANSSQFDYFKYHFPFTVSAPLNSSGAWSMSLADTSTVLPASSQWRLQLCSAPTTLNGAVTCFSVTTAVTCVNNGSCSGTTLDLTSSFASATSPWSVPSLVINGGQAMTNPPEMMVYLGTVAPATLNQTTNAPFVNIKPITITRVDWQTTAQCTVAATLTVTLGGVGSALTVPIGIGAFSGHTDGTLNVAAGAGVTLKTTAAGTTCGTTGINVHYLMQ